MQLGVARRYLRLGLAMGLGLCSAGFAAAAGHPAQARDLYAELQPLKSDLQRYQHLADAIPRLEHDDRIMPLQLLAAVEDELGLYDEAIRDFPFDNRVSYEGELPQPEQWRADDAAEVIAKLAADRRIVMINEAHHDGHTRALTLALLPRLRAAGFTHFAAEALHDGDPELARRGYPIPASGSQYLHEPLYGEIVRQALKLGFVVVSYESDANTAGERESGQARQLYRKVFAADPKARLFIHAGYAHIDKAKGRLGWAAPMAAELARLSGIEPLSIDQTQFREANPRVPHAAYDQLVAAFHPTVPIVLERKPEAGATGAAAWSSDPTLHDVSVILPPDGNAPKDAKAVPGWYTLDGALIPAKPPGEDEKRPDWLGLGGQRLPLAVDGGLCKEKFPCLVEAFYAKEADTAVAADRFAFLDADAQSALYLFPGDYRVRVRDADGKVLEERAVTVARTPVK